MIIGTLAKACQVFNIQRILRLPAGNDGVALVENHSHRSGDVLAGFFHVGIHGLPERCEPLAGVDNVCVPERQLVLHAQGVKVQGDHLQLAQCLEQNGSSGSLIDAPALHAHEPGLNEIRSADSVLSPDPVQRGEEVQRFHALAVDRHGRAALEINDNLSFFVGRFLW